MKVCIALKEYRIKKVEVKAIKKRIRHFRYILKIKDISEVSIQLVKDWIQEENSKKYTLSSELEQIDLALETLDKYENFVISHMYLKKTDINQLENEFNKKFNRKITIEGIKTIKNRAILKIKKILVPYYLKKINN